MCACDERSVRRREFIIHTHNNQWRYRNRERRRPWTFSCLHITKTRDRIRPFFRSSFPRAHNSYPRRQLSGYRIGIHAAASLAGRQAKQAFCLPCVGIVQRDRASCHDDGTRRADPAGAADTCDTAQVCTACWPGSRPHCAPLLRVALGSASCKLQNGMQAFSER